MSVGLPRLLEPGGLYLKILAIASKDIFGRFGDTMIGMVKVAQTKRLWDTSALDNVALSY
jgi:hypothetical protein